MSCKPCKDSPAMIHTGKIMRLSTAKDSRGLRTDDDTVVTSKVSFGMKPVSGREFEAARQQFAAASVIVNLHLSRAWNLSPSDYIEYTTGPLTGRRMNIGYIRDFGGLGLNTEIVCGEGDLSGN